MKWKILLLLLLQISCLFVSCTDNQFKNKYNRLNSLCPNHNEDYEVGLRVGKFMKEKGITIYDKFSHDALNGNKHDDLFWFDLKANDEWKIFLNKGEVKWSEHYGNNGDGYYGDDGYAYNGYNSCFFLGVYENYK